MAKTISLADLLQEKSDIFKVVIFGPESTGKSTLCRQLAAYYKTVCNPEYMRIYLEEKWKNGPRTVTPEDVLHIARGQIERENTRTRQANEILISDTDLLELAVYSQVYFNRTDENLLQAALTNHYDLYFLTYIDVPWEPDPMRDKPHERKEMFEVFKQTLEKYHLPYVTLKGNQSQRLNQAIKIIRTMRKSQIKFSKADIDTLQKRHLTVEEILRQVNAIREGNLYQTVVRPATIGDGIIRLTEEEKKNAVENFDKIKGKLIRFIPASGAATRMFKDFHIVWKNFKNGEQDWDRLLENENLDKLRDFHVWKNKLAFHNAVIDKIKAHHPEYETWENGLKNFKFIEFTLSEKGLNYARYPKALILFHQYPEEIRTAFEEHLKESVLSKPRNTELHFTVSPEKTDLFSEARRNLKDKYGLPVSFSYQSPSTDTIMLDKEKKLVRDEKGKIAFRPGGHGSLLKNLQELDANYIFIKNIDNVQKDEYKTESIQYFKILIGLLDKIAAERNRLMQFLIQEKPGKKDLQEVENFITQTLQQKLIPGYDGLPASHRRTYLQYKLDRPIRVAGMVKNTGQPGGGPFWVKDENDNESLQIVEKSEINLKDESQRKIFESSTHFNPVFMALYLPDHKGEKYDLHEFRNENAAFISQKIQNGQEIHIYEHPGLWNGSMANWITLFVEVPDQIFSPVKEVYDLTKPPHV